jgi:2-polyprenyl-6-hydroxyphenyl methylase/3-demethylubiquinone-9 3-methyltransferase
MGRYYSEKLAGERLRACYKLAPPPARAYLEAEIEFVAERTSRSTRLLELGCGYGRVLQRLIPRVRTAVGIDTSVESLRMAVTFLAGGLAPRLLAMDASRMGFRDRSFDLTICVQNGISAFAADQQVLLAEAVRVTRSGGIVLFSSYAERFWPDRLAWFEVQAAHGLIGKIDYRATGNGVIVCKDGFRATTVDAEGFTGLAKSLGVVPRITEVAASSLFLEVCVP